MLRPWPELHPLAARIAVGELDGDAAIDAIVDEIVRRELPASGASSAVAEAIRAEAIRAVAGDRVLVAMLRPLAPMRSLAPMRPVDGARSTESAAMDLAAPARRMGLPKSKVRVAADTSRDDVEPDTGGLEPAEREAFGSQRGGRRFPAIAGVTLGVLAGGLTWWFLLRETPCDLFARQVCLELAEPCSAGEVQKIFKARAVSAQACDAARVAGELASSTAGPSKRSRAYETAVVAAFGFDPRTGEAPVAAAAPELAPQTPLMLARNLPSLPSFVNDEAYLYVASGEAVLRLRSTGGQFETIAAAPGGRDLVASTDFVYWTARAADGTPTLWVDRKRGEYEPTTLATAPAKLGATRCTQGACAYVDTTDGAVWLVVQDGTPPKKLTGALSPAPTELWIDDREVAFAAAGGPTVSLAAVAVEGGPSRVVAGAETQIEKLGGDAEAWFWVAGGALRTVPRAGGDVTSLVAAGVSAYALEPLGVVVADATAGTLSQLTRAGGPAKVLIAEQTGVEQVAVDQSAIYWTRRGDMFRLPK